MKSYLPLKRAADIAGRAGDDLALLCQAGKLDCRQTDNDWFVAEEEIVNTLSMMNRETLEAELADLRKNREHHQNLRRTEDKSQKLLTATALMLIVLFGAMAVLAWSLNIAQHGDFMAAIYSIWR